ncbi:MAG: diacylglycerol kinase family protein [Sandaracinaceae bacterium]
MIGEPQTRRGESTRPATEPRRYFAVVNPAAGGGRCGKRSAAAIARLRQSGLEVEVHETRRAGEGAELARRAYADGWRSFLAVGGDGTSYEIVNGLFPLEAGTERPSLAILPLGTGNSFLRDFGIDSEARALDAIERGDTVACDVVRATHAEGVLHYINLLSVGFSAEAGELTNRRFKPLGPAGYIAAVLITASRFSSKRFPMRIDDGSVDERKCVLVSFSNSRFTGGTMMMAPRADATDGALDVIRIGEMGRLRFVSSFPSIFVGRHVERPEVEQSRARAVELELDGPVDVMVDGEIQKLE